jgi:hypothetical protein
MIYLVPLTLLRLSIGLKGDRIIAHLAPDCPKSLSKSKFVEIDIDTLQQKL